MKQNSILKTLGAAALLTLAISTANAQQTTGDVTKQANAAPGTTGTSVRVIDNKGTIKYLQAKNGVTMLTNTTNDVTTTTWQLGGTLTDDTFIDVNGKSFALDGLKLVTTDLPSLNATNASSHGGTGTGWTVLIRDEATGETKKIMATDLLQVQAGQQKFVAATAGQTLYTTTGTTLPSVVSKVSVYRNGAKLLAGEDYTVSGSDVTLVPSSTPPNDWVVFVGDVIEVHWIR
ncbi:hypothetical protein [Nubsella zeaxanthinifaciens]|uniref:hypothetical protein n=1 Tax=Nubsella zeaxanthinifaciens TaxID=392412 RepID=UPI000DE3EA7A|nr:hypothetical protein [Nubsella zeaxanthinifaciens]